MALKHKTRKTPWWRFILPQVVTYLTGNPRYLPEIEWSKESWTHNVFRALEAVLWAPAVVDPKTGTVAAKIVPQITTAATLHRGKVVGLVHQVHSFEGACALAETWIRDLFKFKIALPVRLWIPRLSSPGGLPNLTDGYMFAIAFDAPGGRSASPPSSTTLTYPHTQSGSNMGLVVCFKIDTTDGITSVTYNAGSMSQAKKIQQNSGGRWGYMYHLEGAATGSHNVVITADHTCDFIIAKSTSYAGFKQSAQPDATSSGVAAATSLSLSVTVVAANSWAIMYGWTGNAPAASTHVTDRLLDGTPECLGDSNGPVAAGSFSQVMTDTMQNWGGLQASFAPSPTTDFTRALADSIMVGAARTSSLTRLVAYSRALSDSVTRGASRSVTVTRARAITRGLSTSIMNGASRLVVLTFIAPFHTIWTQITIAATAWAQIIINSTSWTFKNKGQ